jgi:hypothetical protein
VTSPLLATVDQKAPFLKVHMRDGDLFVFTKWSVNEQLQTVTGYGDRFGADRVVVPGPHDLTVRFTDVALFETNTIETSASVGAMAIVTGVSIAVSVACLANPKACFGSCPTFYAPGEGGHPVLQAEGFSDAIAPALETHDIDALWRTHTTGGPLVLTMTNEAYETHVVKQANLLVVPKPRGGRVLSTGEELWLAPAVTAPLACDAPEGSCLAAVAAVDGVERTSLTDEHDLATRETIELAFPAAGGRAGIVIGTRQTLVTTFLLYQGLAYLGDTAGTWLAALDGISRHGGRALQHLLGGIEVQIERDGDWQTVGEVYETGPLATDVHLIVLPEGATGEHVRLRLPKGGWRIDYVARATLDHTVTPIVIAPSKIRGTLGAEYAAARVPATHFPIVTMPGDAYTLDYELPRAAADTEYELFLDSRGYYLEWMRQEWMREQDPLAALRFMLDPAKALRDLAPKFKQLEPQAEQLFWRSRYAHP